MPHPTAREILIHPHVHPERFTFALLLGICFLREDYDDGFKVQFRCKRYEHFAAPRHAAIYTKIFGSGLL